MIHSYQNLHFHAGLWTMNVSRHFWVLLSQELDMLRTESLSTLW